MIPEGNSLKRARVGDYQDGREVRADPEALTGATVTAGVSALGDLVATSASDPAVGAALKAIAPVVGYSVAIGWTWAGRQFSRICDFAERLRQRSAEEGLSEEVHEVADLVERALPILGDTATEEKRRLIEDLILNAARQAKTAGSRAEALHALQIIAQLTPEGAVMLGSVGAAANRLGEERHGTRGIAADELPATGLPHFLSTMGLRSLADLGLLKVEDWHTEDDSEAAVIDAVRLTTSGTWLVSWVEVNPTSSGIT